MTKRVYLHIGLPKTGTTYLQDSLWAQRAELRRRGLLIPGRHRRRHLLASFEVREDPSLARRPGDVTRPWGELVEEILASESDALVSHEFFSAAGVPQIQRVLDDLPGREVHVVITARALVEIGLSMWQESVKNRSAIALEKFPAPDSYRPTGVWGWAGIDLADVLTLPVSLAGVPALSAPAGKTALGLPFGIQLIGRWFEEATLLRAAAALP